MFGLWCSDARLALANFAIATPGHFYRLLMISAAQAAVHLVIMRGRARRALVRPLLVTLRRARRRRRRRGAVNAAAAFYDFILTGARRWHCARRFHSSLGSNGFDMHMKPSPRARGPRSRQPAAGGPGGLGVSRSGGTVRRRQRRRIMMMMAWPRCLVFSGPMPSVAHETLGQGASSRLPQDPPVARAGRGSSSGLIRYGVRPSVKQPSSYRR